MGQAAIFAGKRTKLLSSKGLQLSDGSLIDNDGVQNYIKKGNPDAEPTVTLVTTGTIFTASKNTSASSRPDSGFVTSGANLLFSVSESSPLGGTKSYIINKDAVNRQGEQAYIPFTIDSKDQAKVLQIEMDYIINISTFVAGTSTTDSSLIVYVYDVTNNVFIEPSTFKFLSNSTTVSDKFIANFQTAANSTSYRLVFHVADTVATQWQIKLDNIAVKACSYVYGTPITDWQSYSLTIGAQTTPPTKGTTTTDSARWRQVGDSMEIMYNFVQTGAGSAGSGYYKFPLPSGYSADSNKILVGNNNANAIGTASVYNGSLISTGVVQLIDSTNVVMTVGADTLATNQVGSAFYQLSGANIQYGFTASIPITGWSSSVQVSDGYDGREISLRATVNGSTTLATSGDTLIPYALGNGVTYDKVNGLSSSIYTVPSSGRYKVSAKLFITGGQSWTNGDVLTLYAKVDNTTYFPLGSFTAQVTQTITNAFTVGGTVTLDLIAGQTIRIVSNNVLAATKSNQASVPNYNSLEIEKLQAPTTISATEVLLLDASDASGTIISTGATGSLISFGTETKDSHGAYSSGVFTVPISGDYEVSSLIQFSANSTGYRGVKVQKNSSDYRYLGLNGTPSATNGCAVGGETILTNLIAGDTIKIFAEQTSGGNLALVASGLSNWLTIKRVK